MLYSVVEDQAIEPAMFGLASTNGECFRRLTTDFSEMESLAQICNRLQPSPIHFYDIIEDFRKSS